MRKFRKKPLVVEAMQFDGGEGSAANLMAWSEGAVTYLPACHSLNAFNPELAVRTMEGRLLVSAGDWVIKGIKGEFYPHAEAFFFEAYDEVTACSACKREGGEHYSWCLVPEYDRE